MSTENIKKQIINFTKLHERVISHRITKNGVMIEFKEKNHEIAQDLPKYLREVK